ncbi:MAG TPA: substrate-binding domain-containing protein [Nitrososphaerales archaeon]|nr:substrate-binding domain-containing protein [Nitrososphaerales archaeon]
MNRRQFLRAAAILGGGAMIAGGLDYILAPPTAVTTPTSSSVVTSGSSSTGQLPSFSKDYTDFLEWLGTASKSLAGKRLNISLESEFMPLAIQQRDTDFASVTNITDGYNLEPYSLQLAAVQLMTSTQSPTYDVFSVDNQNLGVFNQSMVSPFDLASRYPELTYPNQNYEDFLPILWNNVATYPPAPSGAQGGNSASNVFMLPFDTPVMIFFYRKDIYDGLGIDPPSTWDEYFEDAKMLTGSQEVQFGAVSEASPTISVVYEFTVHLASFGASLWEVDGNQISPVMDSDNAVAALENFVRFQPYSDVSSSNYSWPDIFTSLERGFSACGLLWHDYTDWLNDPQRSVEAGKFGFTAPPAGPKGTFSTFGGAGVGLSKYSNNPEAAWLWLQWATAAGTEEALLLDTYHILPGRQSAINSAEVQGVIKQSSYAASMLAYNLYNSRNVVALVGFPQWFKALDIISQHLNSAWLQQETPRDAMTTAKQEIESLGQLTF